MDNDTITELEDFLEEQEINCEVEAMSKKIDIVEISNDEFDNEDINAIIEFARDNGLNMKVSSRIIDDESKVIIVLD